MIDLPHDPTLDEIRAALVPLVANNAGFDGWTAQAVNFAANAAGIDEKIASLAFDGGPVAMIDAWFATIDAGMTGTHSSTELAARKVRDRIISLIEIRLQHLNANREALRRAMAILAMPQNLAHATKLGWRAADAMWNAAGDTATDYNHYTKRSLLAGIYSATLLVFVNDESEGYADTRAFLGRRIDGIMKFEKAKAQLFGKSDQRLSLSRFIGRLRYPAI
jgi:ubiquinone biosynthesis protein COQ9